jgi:hypothetical protein
MRSKVIRFLLACTLCIFITAGIVYLVDWLLG